jgi:defect-in-organelle-trafficking protein DotC
MTNNSILFPYEAQTPRFEMIRDGALMYASQCALKYYYEEINQSLLSKEILLNRVFNFQPLMLDSDVIPPIVVQAGKTVEQVSSEYLIIADRTFKILRHGSFTTTPLSWKDYLLADIPMPPLPDKSLLPSDSIEQEIWLTYVDQGWNAGKEQAFIMLQNNLAQLIQHYQGMVTFHRLFQQGLMTAPIIQQIESGITMGPDQMHINQKILAIAEQGFLESHHERWHSYMFYTD